MIIFLGRSHLLRLHWLSHLQHLGAVEGRTGASDKDADDGIKQHEGGDHLEEDGPPSDGRGLPNHHHLCLGLPYDQR